MADGLVDEQAIFEIARKIEAPESRRACVEQMCGHQPELRRRVTALLRAHVENNSFLELPPPELAGEGLVATLERPAVENVGCQIGPYKLRELLGEGGMGNVFVAEQEEPIRRKVALKLIKPGMDSRQVLARFDAERQALSLMDHPNVAKVLDAGTTEAGRPYFVMELVRGVPITEFCDQRRLDPQQRLAIFVQVCRGIQHAHQKGIIHRDVKPTNVLVTLHDGIAVPKVIDFGIAKATGQRLSEQTVYTAFSQMIGTPLYMSPEQAEMSALDVDTRSDVYSLGVLLYELLTGATPFDRDTLREAGFDEMRRLIREVDPPRPSLRVSTLAVEAASTVSQSRGVDQRRLHRSLRGDLDWIVMKALQKDRNQRYESASALAADVQRHLDDEPIEAKQPRILAGVRRWRRRHRTATTAAMVAVIVVTVLTTASSLLLVEAYSAQSSARHAAELEQAKAERERQRAKQVLGRMQLESGVERLNQGNDLGLLDLLNAAETSADLPSQRETSRRFWAIGYATRQHTLTQVLEGCSGGLAYSPDGSLLATVDGKIARLWDVSTGELHVPPIHASTDILSFRFSADGQQLAILSDGEIRRWETRTGAPAGPVRRLDSAPGENSGEANQIQGGTFSPDGTLVVTLGSDTKVRFWDARTGEPNGAPLEWKSAEPSRIAFSPNGNLLAASWLDGPDVTLTVWDLATRTLRGEPVKNPEFNGLPNFIHEIVFSPNGSRLAMRDSSDFTYVFDADTGKEIARMETDWINDLAFSPDGTLLATGGVDWTVRLWDAATGKQRGEPMRHDGRIRVLAFSPDGAFLASGSVDRTLRLWKTATGEAIGAPLQYGDVVERIAFSSDGERLAAGFDDTRVWQIQKAAELNPRNPNGRGYTIVSPDGRHKARITEPLRNVELIDTKATANATRLITHDRVIAMAFSPDSRFLATGAGSWSVKLWEVTAGREVASFNCPERIYGVAFNPAGNLLAVALFDGNVILQDLDTGHRRGLPMKHPASARGVAFSPDGSLLVATVANPLDWHAPQDIWLWDISGDTPYLGLALPLKAPRRQALDSFDLTGKLEVDRPDAGGGLEWQLPGLPQDLHEMRLRTLVALGLRHDLRGQPAIIRANEWRALRDELKSLAKDTPAPVESDRSNR